MADKLLIKKPVDFNHQTVENLDVSYESLEDKPTIPSKTSQLENDSGFIDKIAKPYIVETAAWGVSGKTGHFDKNASTGLSDCAVGDYIFSQGIFWVITKINTGTVDVTNKGNYLTGGAGAPYITASNGGWGISGDNRSFDRSALTPNLPAVGSIIYSATVGMYFKVNTIGTGSVSTTRIFKDLGGDTPTNMVTTDTDQTISARKTFKIINFYNEDLTGTPSIEMSADNRLFICGNTDVNEPDSGAINFLPCIASNAKTGLDITHYDTSDRQTSRIRAYVYDFDTDTTYVTFFPKENGTLITREAVGDVIDEYMSSHYDDGNKGSY